MKGVFLYIKVIIYMLFCCCSLVMEAQYKEVNKKRALKYNEEMNIGVNSENMNFNSSRGSKMGESNSLNSNKKNDKNSLEEKEHNNNSTPKGNRIGSNLTRDRSDNNQQLIYTQYRIEHTIIENKYASDNWSEDTVYYSNVRRDNGWIVGVGEPLSKSQRNMQEKVYRLTMRLSNGRFMHIESLKNGNLEFDSFFQPYILHSNCPNYDYDFDYLNVPNWILNIYDISHVYLIPDATMENVAIEQACDSEGFLVHSMCITKVSDNKFVAYYADPDGDIINLLNPQRYRQGNAVIIETNTGDDGQIVTITDRDGWPVKINN